jgi:two-component system OmpR family sensor kinase
MASIRTRLTAWNGGVLVLVLCVFAIAAYVFLRYATFAQVDRALHQQVSVVELTARAQAGSSTGRRDLLPALVKDLEVHGLLVRTPPSLPNALVTTPVRIEREDEGRRDTTETSAARPDIDWNDLRAKLGVPRDDDEAFTVRGRRGGIRVLTEQLSVDGHAITLIATQPLHETVELLETARTAALIALPIAVLLAVLSGYVLARRALDPIAAMTVQARRIGSRNLHERLTIRNSRDELGQLALTFNEVLQRVDGALEHQRRFTADASHELRTPIALIRAEADVALSDGVATDGEYRAALSVIRDGSHQLSRIVNDLFLLARADAGQTLVSRHPMYLDELVTSTVHSMRALADNKDVALQVRVPGDVPYQADEELLRRALRNLLDNAIKYSAGAGKVDVSLERDGGVYRITVTDDGRGMSANDQAHIFERFFRGDSSRPHSESANSAGAGLGLAIAREIAELHGGHVDLRRSDASGSMFELTLPTVESSIRSD